VRPGGARGARRGRALIALGSALAALALAGIFYPLWWQARANRGASHLLGQALALRAQSSPDATSAAGAVASYCLGTPKGAKGALGVLDIPALGVVAPVVNGVSEADIAIAVGHDPASPWPGSPGESLLLAHDVSFFSRLSSLRPGDEILFAKGCTLSRYRVVSAKVTKPGTLMPTPPGGAGLGLITCWPTNALFWTPDRYAVQSVLVSTAPITKRLPTPAGLPPVPKVEAAPSLVSAGIGLRQNEVPLGTLEVHGSPAASFSQGPGPLADERAVLHAYFAARKAAVTGTAAWWQSVAANGVPMPGGWANRGPLSIHLDVAGVRLVAATAVAPDVTVRFGVRDGVLSVLGVSTR
jgi:sortase A